MPETTPDPKPASPPPRPPRAPPIPPGPPPPMPRRPLPPVQPTPQKPSRTPPDQRATLRHVAVYVRVSSAGQSTASQEPDLKRWAEGQDQSVTWYRDKFTGKSMDRPGWNKLEAALEAGKVAAVVVWRLDRLGRTAKGLTALFDDLVVRKVNLVSLREGIDLATPAGRMIANVIASMAQYETEIRAERVLAGQAAARAQGKHLGRRPGIRTRIKVTPEQEAQVRRLKAEGQGVTAIARATGLSRPTIYSILDSVLVW